MALILINGISAKSAGGKSVLRNFLTALASAGPTHDYVVIVPIENGYQDLAGPRIAIQPHSSSRGLARLTRYSLFELPKILRNGGFDLLFNLSDIPVPTPLPQAFLFDWSYAAFPESPAWRLGSVRDRVLAHAKLAFFKRLVHQVDLLGVQTPVIGERLRAIYPSVATEVVPNAVSMDNLAGGEDRDFALGGGFKLLCLSAYYPHKNLEILLPTAREIARRGLAAEIVITLAAGQQVASERFLKAIKDEGLEQVLVNVGAVPMAHVPSLYRQCDALLLPTLLESFSGTYVEAMFHERVILTSALPFAEDVCRDAALYFDPMDPNEIVDRIEWAMTHPNDIATLVGRGKALVEAMPDWPMVVRQWIGVFDRLLAK